MLDDIINGNTLDVLKTLPSDSIDTIITSPPYWGLRNYGKSTNTVWDGDPNCEHEFELTKSKKQNMAKAPEPSGLRTKLENLDNEGRGKKEIKWQSGFCSKCGAWYGQLGLEPTLDLYIKHLLQITDELKRVLKPTGVMFWNHGDSYCGSQGHFDAKNPKAREGKLIPDWGDYPKKCLYLQNYRIIIHMIDEQGWILRNTIIWHKPNHMPSSVKDRFANAYEPVFMLTKSKKYFFDLDAVRVPHKIESIKRAARARKSKKLDVGQYSTSYKNEYIGYDDLEGKLLRGELRGTHPLGKNPGDVWEISTEGFPEAHFATFPEKLVEPMVKAGCPQWICKKCGNPRERITKKKYIPTRPGKNTGNKKSGTDLDPNKSLHEREISKYRMRIEYNTVNWTDCDCDAGWDAGVVLDPFAGSGTTLYVARKLGRHYIGIELNPEYVKMAKKRLSVFGERLDKFVDI